MTKIVTFVGVSAMVLMLGLGSGLAQSSAPKESSAAPAVMQTRPSSTVDRDKEKAVPEKPGLEAKTQTAAPTAPTSGKEADKGLTPKPDLSAKPNAVAPAKSPADQPAEKATVAKPAIDTRAGKADAAKPVTEKAPEPKTPVRQ